MGHWMHFGGQQMLVFAFLVGFLLLSNGRKSKLETRNSETDHRTSRFRFSSFGLLVDRTRPCYGLYYSELHPRSVVGVFPGRNLPSGSMETKVALGFADSVGLGLCGGAVAGSRAGPSGDASHSGTRAIHPPRDVARRTKNDSRPPLGGSRSQQHRGSLRPLPAEGEDARRWVITTTFTMTFFNSAPSGDCPVWLRGCGSWGAGMVYLEAPAGAFRAKVDRRCLSRRLDGLSGGRLFRIQFWHLTGPHGVSLCHLHAIYSRERRMLSGEELEKWEVRDALSNLMATIQTYFSLNCAFQDTLILK